MCYCSVLWLCSAGEADHSRRLLSLLPELHLHPGCKKMASRQKPSHRDVETHFGCDSEGGFCGAVLAVGFEVAACCSLVIEAAMACASASSSL